MKYIFIIGNSIILIIAIIWLYADPGPKPLIVCISATLALTGFAANSTEKNEENKKIKSLYFEILENLSVSESAKPWTTYSLENRTVIEELRSKLGGELYNKIKNIYLEFEGVNRIITNISKGNFGQQNLNRYYKNFVDSLESIIKLLGENKNFKRFAEK